MNYRREFPFFTHSDLIYLDNAATTHKPQVVIDAMARYYTHENAPVHRGLYGHAEQATTQYEAARATMAQFINAQDSSEVVFTRNTTEGINLIAQAWAVPNLQPGDEIVLTELEHHANLAPWIRLVHEKGVNLRFIPANKNLTLDISSLGTIISPRAKLVAFSPISNMAGALPEQTIQAILNRARQVGAKVLLDAAQMAGHQRIDVAALGSDFLVFSGHKMFGPTGSGIAYIRSSEHKRLAPYQVGGGMVHQVSYDNASWRPMPHLLEAGSPATAQALGLAAAARYIMSMDRAALSAHETGLVQRFLSGLQVLPAYQLIGDPTQLAASHLVCFTTPHLHAHDLAAALAHEKIAVRAGNHCCQPLHAQLGIPSSVRVSFAHYNTTDEVDLLLAALAKIAQDLERSEST